VGDQDWTFRVASTLPISQGDIHLSLSKLSIQIRNTCAEKFKVKEINEYLL